MTAAVVHRIANRIPAQAHRRFPGLTAPAHGHGADLQPRQALPFALQIGDILSLNGIAEDHALRAVVFAEDGRPAAERLGLVTDGGLDSERFDAQHMAGWVQARMPGQSLAALPSAPLPHGHEPLLLKAAGAVTVWIISYLDAEALTAGRAPGPVAVSVAPAARSTPALPPAFCDVRDEFTIPRGSARAFELAPGEFVQIIDIEGQQCSDFMAFSASGLDAGREDMIDSTATRSMVRRTYPGPGLFDKFYDAEMRPLLNVVQDTCGRHDTFGLACTARGYEERGFPGHLNCSDNISASVAPFGVARRNAWPAINFFWNTWVAPGSHHIQTEESWSRPGDFVTLRAIEPLVCVSTACPDDIDPINGWNPTDIHVRIYRPDAPIRRAVAYQRKETAPVMLSQESAFHPATSQLTRDFSPARNLWIPNSYSSVGTLEEYWACRTAATLQDMSALKKFDVIGPDAERLLQIALTRDVAKLAVWRGTYALMCDAQGEVIDDGTLFRLSGHLFRWCCGSEESARHLSDLAQAHGLQARINDASTVLPNLALQGPKSRDILRKILFSQPHVPALDELKWFGVTTARLGDRTGLPIMLSRSGYTGELGYELFCSASDALQLWDAVMAAGAEFGIQPMGSAALEMIRIEAGLAAASAEFAPGVDAFEAGLGFAVDLKKADFVGKSALERNASAPRRVLRGLCLTAPDAVQPGSHVFAGERPVGVVTSATYSPSLECGIAMARLAVEQSETGTVLEVGQLDGRMKRLSAEVCDTPFIDPTRSRARA